MKLCDICGNEIGSNTSVCPYCDSPQHNDPKRPAKRSAVAVIDLEHGHLTVRDALLKLDARIASERMLGTKVLKVIHGWGSSGRGGAIKNSLPAHLDSLKKRGQIRAYIRGEAYDQFTEDGRRLVRQHKQLHQSFQSDVGNPGITLVILPN
jgi:DNA-nicking Smr family endonuclease